MNNDTNTNEEIETLTDTTPVTPPPASTTPVEPVTVTPTPTEPVTPVTPPPVVNPTPVVPPVAPVQNTVVEPQTTGSITINGETVNTTSTDTTKTEEKKPFNVKIIIYPVVILILAGVFIFLLINKNKNDPAPVPNKTPTPTAIPSNVTPLENITITGTGCFNSDCSVSIGSVDNSIDYKLDAKNIELFRALSDYEDYVSVNVYYVQQGENKVITDYKILLKSTGEDLGSMTTEDELRRKIGLFPAGTYTESLTLTEIGSDGIGSNDEGEYTFKEYTFTDSNNKEYEMKYKNPDDSLKLTEGSKYTVAFEVIKDEFGYEYYITSIK